MMEAVCRICAASNKDCEKLFNDGAEALVTSSMRRLLGIEVSEDDGAPDGVCLVCSRTLEQFRRFVAGARKADQMFKNNQSSDVVSDAIKG